MARHPIVPMRATGLLALILAFGAAGCAPRDQTACTSIAPAATGTLPAGDAIPDLAGLRIRILNPGAKHLDAIVTRESFNRLFPPTVWFQEGDVVGMYNRESRMTFLVVSEHTFDSWNDELSTVAERLCHEKAHRADDLYGGDQWSELRDTSGPGLQLDTHHFGHASEDQEPHSGAFMMTQAATNGADLAPPPSVVPAGDDDDPKL